MNDRSRAVNCQYKGGGYCALSTKDASELCHHHRRNSTLHKSTPNGAPKLRLHEATMRLVNGDTAALNSKVVLDNMPRVHRTPTTVAVSMGSAASLPTDTITWDNQSVTLVDQQVTAVTTPGGTFELMKDGSWVKARFPDNCSEDTTFLLLAQAYNTRTHSAQRLFAAQGMFDGYGERYDDKAEVLVQLPLNDDPDSHVTYTSASDGEVKLRIASKDADGNDQTETYSVFIERYKLESGGVIAPNNEVQMPGRLHTKDGASDVPEALSNRRAQLFHNVTEALNVIDTYSAKGEDGALYLPVGWMER